MQKLQPMKYSYGKVFRYGSLIALSGYLYFNRNPKREIQTGIVSPSDGVIESISSQNHRIDIFIGLTDVHYQRAPVDGYVTDIYEVDGFNIITIGNLSIERMGGIIARSIRTFVNIGDYVMKGQIIGRILLGSHVAIYPVYSPNVAVGDHVLAGQTLGDI